MEPYRTNHFELYVNNIDDIRLNTKDVKCSKSAQKSTVVAKVYLTEQNYATIESLSNDDIYKIRLVLYSSDGSLRKDFIESDMKLVSKSCDLSYESSEPIIVYLTFESVYWM